MDCSRIKFEKRILDATIFILDCHPMRKIGNKQEKKHSLYFRSFVIPALYIKLNKSQLGFFSFFAHFSYIVLVFT